MCTKIEDLKEQFGSEKIAHTVRTCMRSVESRTTKFRREEHGGILVLFALMFVPIVIIIGFAMELALAEHMRVKLQNTADSASLASADLEQTLQPKAVATDFFAKAGLGDHLTSVEVETPTRGGRAVTVTAEASFGALLTRLAGLRAWNVPVLGSAKEARGDIEIALVLDNSSSMSWLASSTSGAPKKTRMDLLIPAAEAFVEEVQPKPGEGGTTTISLIPFATQVSVGQDLLNQFNVTSEHDVSHCVTFINRADFASTSILKSSILQRTAHHDPTRSASQGWGLSDDYIACPTNSSIRDIFAWSQDPDSLKARIRSMKPYGFTSIEIGVKWGTALLDPAMRPVLTSMSALPAHSYLAEPSARGVPFDFAEPTSQKYLVVMSDGENTTHQDIKPPYRDGLSPVWQYTGKDNFAYYLKRLDTDRAFYHVKAREWRDDPGPNAVQLTWPQVWARVSVKKFVRDINGAALRSAPGFSVNPSLYSDIVYEQGKAWKNQRTSEICQAAKERGIIVFTIGMDTYGQGDATLADCASEKSLFYDIVSEDIDMAFAQVARQITRLRLTQ